MSVRSQVHVTRMQIVQIQLEAMNAHANQVLQEMVLIVRVGITNAWFTCKSMIEVT